MTRGPEDAVGTASHDVVVVGGGPAGLSAALGLVRARRDTLVLDSNRPRNAATLHSHGFLTRDGVSPLELRRLGRAEVESYPGGECAFARVDAVERSGDRFLVHASGVRGEPDRHLLARALLVATGLAERMPRIDGLRGAYGTHLHSCVHCDGYEKADGALALIGESEDLAERALLLAHWSADLIVFTNGRGTVTPGQEQALAERGIRTERRPIAAVELGRDRMLGLRLEDGQLVERSGGFVRPEWHPALDFLAPLDPAIDDDGLLRIDDGGRTATPGLYACGESTAPGPEQLMVAAGSGARVAATITRDLLGLSD